MNNHQQDYPKTKLSLSVQSSLQRLLPDLNQHQTPTTCLTEDDITRRALAASGLNVSAPEFVPSSATPTSSPVATPTKQQQQPQPLPPQPPPQSQPQASFIASPIQQQQHQHHPHHHHHHLNHPHHHEHPLSSPLDNSYHLYQVPNPDVYSNVTDHLTPSTSRSPSSPSSYISNPLNTFAHSLSSNLPAPSNKKVVPQQQFDIHFPALNSSNVSPIHKLHQHQHQEHAHDNNMQSYLNNYKEAMWLSPFEDDEEDNEEDEVELQQQPNYDWNDSNTKRHHQHNNNINVTSPNRFSNHNNLSTMSSRRISHNSTFQSSNDNHFQPQQQKFNDDEFENAANNMNNFSSSSPSAYRRGRRSAVAGNDSNNRGGGNNGGRSRGRNRNWGWIKERDNNSIAITYEPNNPKNKNQFEQNETQGKINWSTSIRDLENNPSSSAVSFTRDIDCFIDDNTPPRRNNYRLRAGNTITSSFSNTNNTLRNGRR